MAFNNKILVCVFIMFAVSLHAQTYPKYTTSKAKPAATVKKEKPVEAEVKAKSVAQKAESQPETKKTEVKIPEVSAAFNDFYSKAEHLFKERKFAEAVKAYTQALAVSPEEWKYLVLKSRGNSYLELKDYNNAIKDCTTAIETTKVHNKLALGNLYYIRSLAYKARQQGGDMDLACADYKKVQETGFMRGRDTAGFDCDDK